MSKKRKRAKFYLLAKGSFHPSKKMDPFSICDLFGKTPAETSFITSFSFTIPTHSPELVCKRIRHSLPTTSQTIHLIRNKDAAPWLEDYKSRVGQPAEDRDLAPNNLYACVAVHRVFDVNNPVISPGKQRVQSG